jgi:hypothetical protein
MRSLADLVPSPYLERICAGDFDGFPSSGPLPASAGPLPPEAAFFYCYGACHYLAEALCSLLGSYQLALVVHQGEALHVYAVQGEWAYDASGRQRLQAADGQWGTVVCGEGLEASARELARLTLAEWQERYLGEDRFRPIVADSPTVRRCAVNAAELVLASALPAGNSPAAPTLAVGGSRAPILDR